MLKTIATCETSVLKNCYGFSWGLQRQFSADTVPRPSYVHKLGSKPMRYQNIGQVLKETATKFPNRLSLTSCVEKAQLTYEEVLDKADRLASGLLNLGFSKGDCVAIWAPNYEFWYVSNFAIARAGLICVPMNPAYQLPEADYCLKKIDIKAIIIPESFRTQKYYEMISTLVPSLKHSSGQNIQDNKVNSLKNVIVYTDNKLPGAIRYKDLMKSSESDNAEIEKLQPSILPDSGCNIQFTSGTTGQPKAALLSHFSVVNTGSDMGIRLEFDKFQRKICSSMPFFHIAGIIAVMNTMTYGSSLVLPGPHFNAELSINTIVREKCDGIYATPSMYVDMIAKQKELNVELPEVAISLVGAAICTPKLVKDALKYLNIKKFQSVYGLTESTAAGFQTLTNEDPLLAEEFVGCVADNVEVKIIDLKGDTVPFGQPGELCIRGYPTMLGYFEDEKKTKEVIGEDKWLRTGDQFILNEDGYGKIIGRLKDMIIRGGENLFPREIEDFLNTHPNILETHVIGIPDERMGEEVGAFIRLKDNTKELTHDEVKNFCKGKLSHFKVPRYVIVVREFPRTSTGKVQKIKFLEHFSEEIKKLL